ncbi:aldehyde dehydrogenase [Rhizobium sp. AC44/96]|uniref:aldehyde dehydrogenase family protein n=1 Tax=unclassified Rhizobium TaxID=2613769 RepID=UPI00080F7811|nr:MULTISPECIES: aldehyde dehydrogenase family protein [unclassified Rhizobium]MDM9622724.1 aldehyde dehydrogenase family protein [Rhizobium sp. S96]OCJ13441.1 aldehyde dehydrogenase [Rhizobium sp. AC44/96]
MTDYVAMTDGKPVRNAATFAVINPATGEEAGRAPNMTSADLDAAVAAAKAAFPAWSAQSDEKLQAACAAVTAKIEEHAAELAEIITLEQGKPLNGLGSRWEMGGAVAWAGYTTGLSLPVKVLQDNSDGRVELHRKPLGVVGSITPWNFPVMIAVWHILPALRSGNTVVVKPSPFTPLSTLRLVAIMNEVLPSGVVNVVTGDDQGLNLGAAMSAHPDIRKIVFTGSCATGQKIMQTAAPTMKRLTLEMGGNDAGIVLPDADPKAIAEGLFWGAFINNGQTCAAMKRLYVHESIHDAVCEALVDYARNIPVGNGMDEASVLGPVQNRMQFDKLSRLVADAKGRGQVLLGGAPGEGLFFPPTIIAGLTNGDALVDEEQFGPALPVIRYSDVDDAIAMANDSSNGLGGSVWSSDIAAAKRVASRMECGSVWINKHGAIQPNAPFGGVKSSGFGVEFAEEGLQEYTDIQVVFA